MEKYTKGEFRMLLAGNIAAGFTASGLIHNDISAEEIKSITSGIAKVSLDIATEIIKQGSSQSSGFDIYGYILQ